jgi:antitoxin component YwqK of YwqJK toxin-antitoxin module
MSKKIKNLLLGIAVLIFIFFLGCENHLKKEIFETYGNGHPKKVIFYSLSEKNKEVIKEIQYYENGKKKYVGYFKNNQKDGKWVFWFENGKKWSEGYFLQGTRTGKTYVYHENGKLFYEGEYLEGKKNGKWVFYNEEGEKANVVNFVDGEIKGETNKMTIEIP